MDSGGVMSDEVVLRETAAGVATLTLNRPEKRNALNAGLVRALKEALEKAGSDDAVKVVAIKGAGPDFCAGGDLAELEQLSAMSREENLADARSLGALLSSLRDFPKPVVAVVHGRALAGGCGLATACDIVLAHQASELGYPEVHLGFVPAMVMAILRRKVTEGRAFELVARGHRVTAVEARTMGLVNHVIPAENFDADVGAYLRDLAGRPASAVALIKALLYEQGDLSVEEGIERGAQVNVEARMTEECREGVRRFLERHGPGDRTG
jgi:methylglutaconyl-CoA hydratase